MGHDTSRPLAQVPPGFSTMCISTQYSDGMSVLHSDSESLSSIQEAIIQAWPGGIQRQIKICGTGTVLKIKGLPFFHSTGPKTSANARQMIAFILQKLYSIGWKVVVSCNLARYLHERTMILKKSPSNFPFIHPFVCVGLDGADKLQTLNLPSQMIEPLKQVVYQFWNYGVLNESYENGVLEIEMAGNPWCVTDLLSVMAKILLQNIIAFLYRYQYVYTVNVNLKTTANSLYFCYDPNVPTGEAAQFCTISLNRSDRLRVICAPAAIVDMIREVIQRVWSHGRIQEEKDDHGSWEFGISGNPWHSCKEESVMAKYLILKILEAMLEQGWHNIAAIDTSRLAADKSVLIFKQGEPKRCSMMCLSLNDADTFFLINMPPELDDLFRQILLSRWSKGIKEEKMMNLSFGNVRQLKLKGSPWNGGLHNDTYHIHSFLCNVIEAFAAEGWRVMMAGDVSAQFVRQGNRRRYPMDVHSFWFVYEGIAAQQATTTSYEFNVSSSPYGAATNMPAGFGLYPYPPNEPPPSYDETTGWNAAKN